MEVNNDDLIEKAIIKSGLKTDKLFRIKIDDDYFTIYSGHNKRLKRTIFKLIKSGMTYKLCHYDGEIFDSIFLEHLLFTIKDFTVEFLDIETGEIRISRVILFRGKSKENCVLNYKKGDWVHGNFIEGVGGKDDCYINPKGTLMNIKVDSKTISQYIGEKYIKNIAEFDSIYEGDIILDTNKHYGVLKYDENKHQYFIYYGRTQKPIDNVNFIIVGNIWDNPELAEKSLDFYNE